MADCYYVSAQHLDRFQAGDHFTGDEAKTAGLEIERLVKLGALAPHDCPTESAVTADDAPQGAVPENTGQRG